MFSRNTDRLIATALAAGIYVSSVQAGEFDGAWANDKEACEKMFTQANGRTVLTKDADFYGSGFVVDGGTIRGKSATCKIKSTTKTQNKVRISATCATDVMLSDTKFDLAIGADGELIRSFPGMPEMTLSYHRCAPAR